MHRVNVPLALRTTSRTCLESESGNGEPELAGDDAYIKSAITHQRDYGIIIT